MKGKQYFFCGILGLLNHFFETFYWILRCSVRYTNKVYFKAYAGVSRTEKQKQSPGDVRLKRFRKNFAKLKKKTTFMGSLFDPKACEVIKNDSSVGGFLWILRNFSGHLFCRTSANSCFLLHLTLNFLGFGNEEKRICASGSKY